MPTPTYKALANITLSSSAASVTFGSIPSTYRDLVVVVAGSASGGDGIYVRFNSDTGSNYSFVRMFGTGTTNGSTSGSSQTSGEFGEIWTAQNVNLLHIMDYSATDKHKTFLGRTASPSNVIMAHAGRWANTSTVDTVTIRTSVTNFSSGTSFALYGIES